MSMFGNMYALREYTYKYHLTLFLQDNKDPLVVEFQDGFVWPYFVLDANVLRQVGLDSLPPFVSLNLYRPQLNMWTTISIDHVVHLTSDSTRVFLKPSTINRCKDLHRYTSALPSISRINVTAERAYMKSRSEQERLEQAYAALATQPTKHNLSPGSANVLSPKRPRFAETIQVAPITHPHPRSRTNVVKRKKDVLVIYGSDSEAEDPAPFSSPIQRSPPTISSPDDTPIIFGRRKAAWPGGRSVNDIVAGFSKIDELASQPGYTVSMAFEEHFNMKFPKTTFYEHRDRWNSASPTDRDTAQASDISWTSFAETHPTSHAAEKAARKRRQRLLRRATEPSPCLSQDHEADEIEYVTDA
jgi:hypothetical protein